MISAPLILPVIREQQVCDFCRGKSEYRALPWLQGRAYLHLLVVKVVLCCNGKVGKGGKWNIARITGKGLTG